MDRHREDGMTMLWTYLVATSKWLSCSSTSSSAPASESAPFPSALHIHSQPSIRHYPQQSLHQRSLFPSISLASLGKSSIDKRRKGGTLEPILLCHSLLPREDMIFESKLDVALPLPRPGDYTGGANLILGTGQ